MIVISSYNLCYKIILKHMTTTFTQLLGKNGFIENSLLDVFCLLGVLLTKCENFIIFIPLFQG